MHRQCVRLACRGRHVHRREGRTQPGALLEPDELALLHDEGRRLDHPNRQGGSAAAGMVRYELSEDQQRRTDKAVINNTAGLPGPGALILPGTVVVNKEQ